MIVVIFLSSYVYQIYQDDEGVREAKEIITGDEAKLNKGYGTELVLY
jgi:hypothetical protein